MAHTLTVIGAYGRDYTNDWDTLAAWNSGVDFRIVADSNEFQRGARSYVGSYVSKHEVPQDTEVFIRYYGQREKIQALPCLETSLGKDDVSDENRSCIRSRDHEGRHRTEDGEEFGLDI